MKKVFWVFTMMAGVFVLASCNQKKEATVEEIETVSVINDEIVKDSVVGVKGDVLYLTFNNSKGLVNVVLQGDTITLLQDTTASGIKFNNTQYVYEEWQGQITLKKDGNIVFEKKK